METDGDLAIDSSLGGVVVPLIELGDELADNNIGAAVAACIWALAALSAGWLALRLYLKLRKNWGLWWDDHLLTISWVCIVLSNISTSVAISQGWGQQPYEISPSVLPQILLALLISGLFSILGATISKTSFALTLLRISSGWVKWTVWFAIVTINVAMGLSLIFNWVQCTPVQKNFIISTPGSCWPRETLIGYNTFASGYSGAMDVLLALLPWKIIWKMEMTRKERIGAICAMSLGLFAATIALAKIYALIGTFQAVMSSSIQLVVLSIAETAVTIMAASIPILRALARDRPSPGGERLFTLNFTEHLTLRRSSGTQPTSPTSEPTKTGETPRRLFKVMRKASSRRAPVLSKIVETDELSPGLLRDTPTGERVFV
ncbi:hypothetical protein F5Y08DRAFT_291778 [Xylaria arbuscula]|uniref:Rhodopsin domain-containing protein n=1 Tax=Xylaria arbuscula TaxID=114810 RepID=A0A9W8ND31_9PEZI|nr:hypothetical protein F5Y08DRAFT_291778 [Xylaria arbuscula]KAJ3569415.1 hypothetical protein NPX13_g6093 [Xylaria arbuscula]